MIPESIFLNYEKRLVAFIDVMGFQGLLNGDVSVLQSYYNHAYEFLEGKSSLYAQTAPNDQFKRLFVSDSIILSVILTDDKNANLQAAARFFSSIALLQYLLAVKTQIWTRGAVSVGDLYIEEDRNILVGPAFVQAYELEKLADYPRVIIDPKILKFFEMDQIAFIKKINSYGYPGNLMGAGSVTRWGMSTYTNDAIQIDWFRQVYDRSEKIEKFFEDLQSRQLTNQSLFEKSNRLVGYLSESFSRFRSDKKDLMQQTNILNRAKKVLKNLQIFSPELSSVELK